ncbi:SDR family NAD(P)-dependent oxidoreductase [Nocardia callitridis]|uniref:Dehydrogenase n=1 Tax=Nocardia callitridis TaxID=648753 RepID=A0ABP9L261_9NOCA
MRTRPANTENTANTEKVDPGLLDAALDRAILPGYSRFGLWVRRRAQPADSAEPAAMRGRTAVVTGANSGIGKECASALARRGATVVLAVRNRARGEQARADIVAACPEADVRVALCDVSDRDSVLACAEKLNDELARVDVLIHNAGALPSEREENAQGHELALATHVLGPLLLTDRLMPALTSAPAPRVIFVSSGGMYAQPLVVDDPEYRHGRYRGATAYSRTKRMQVALTPLIAEHYAPQGLSDVHSMHPGWVNTPGIAASLPGFHRLTGPLLRSPAEGADTAVWLATTSTTLPPGRFWHDRKVRPEHYLRRTRYTADEVERLWRYCGTTVGIAVD